MPDKCDHHTNVLLLYCKALQYFLCSPQTEVQPSLPVFLQKIKSPSGDYCCKCGRIHKNHQTNGLVRAPKERCGGFTKYLAALSFTSRWRHRSVISKATESQFELAVWHTAAFNSVSPSCWCLVAIRKRSNFFNSSSGNQVTVWTIKCIIISMQRQNYDSYIVVSASRHSSLAVRSGFCVSMLTCPNITALFFLKRLISF